MSKDIQTQLSNPFENGDIEWRLQRTNKEKTSGLAVPYVTNRAIQARLDKVLGIHGWRNEFIPWHSDGKKDSQLCGISIHFAERNEWITKFDGAEDSAIEPIKGGLSDAMKRAAVQWGIGRYLYSMEAIWVDVEMRGDTAYIRKDWFPKLDAVHRKHVNSVFANVPSASLKSETPAQDKPSDPPAPPASPAVATDKPDLPLKKPTPAPAIPADAFLITGAVIQPAMNSGTPNTNLQLKAADGSVISAYMRGTNPAVVKGAWLVNAVLTEKLHNGVIFYTISKFEVVAPQAA